MVEHSKIHERVFGSRMQNQDVWFLIKEDNGNLLVLHERRIREKGEKSFSKVEQERMSVREAMCKGGKLAKNLWYAVPDSRLRD